MTIPNTYDIKDLEKNKFVDDGSGNVAVRTTAIIQGGDIEIGAVEIKNGTTDQRAVVDTTGALRVFDSVNNSLVPSVYDYIGVSYPTTSSEVYTYKTGGSGGTTVSTITLVYSDAVTKNILVSVTKT